MSPKTREQIVSELTAIFQRVFDDDSIRLTDDMKASDIPEWDSLNHLKLIIAAEKQFGIRFHAGEISGFANVGHFIDAVSIHLGRAS